MVNTKKEMRVYAHWLGLAVPNKMGILTVTPARGKETFSFEYAADWLKSGFSQMLDPDLQLYSGSFYPRDEKINFGIFLDSCPDPGFLIFIPLSFIFFPDFYPGQFFLHSAQALLP